MALELVCSCGAVAPADATACTRRGSDNTDHVLFLPAPLEWVVEDADNPFVRYRRMLTSWQSALADGLSDQEFVDLVVGLDDAIAAIDGRRFLVSPLHDAPALGDHIGARLSIKDETGGVSGSHKARHLMGIMVHLLARERVGSLTERPPLAIASCGNAALAASVVARAADWPLQVYVPPTGDPLVLDRIRSLDAELVVSERTPELPPGDPCYLGFGAAVTGGAIAFGCQGPDNALAIDGGRTLGWEIAEQAPDVSRVVVQVGGAALVSSVGQGLQIAADLGAIGAMPEVDTVQTQGCAPLARAFAAVNKIGDLTAAIHQRDQIMWPWEQEPHSAAYGILDDETYDWQSAVRLMRGTEGDSVVVGEDRVMEAHDRVRDTTDLTPCVTGTSGLAGVLELAADGRIAPDEHVVALITGIDRTVEAEQRSRVSKSGRR